MSLGVVVAVVAACLVLEAFFSGAELALISADRVKLRAVAERSGGLRQRMMRAFLDEPGQLISACLVGTNVCVVLISVVVTLGLLPRFPRQAELISLGVVAPLVLVFGEIVPKSVFHHHADRLAPRLVTLLSYFRLAVLPLVLLGSRVSALLLRLLRIQAPRVPMTREELRLMIELPSRAGEDRITADERTMVGRVFGFTRVKAVEVMLPLSEVTAVPADATVEEVAREIADKQYTRLPVYRERVDHIEGVVHAFDVLRARPEQVVSDIGRPAIFVPESQPAVDVLVSLQRQGQGMAVVVDEYGGAVGVTTIEDIVEEIVGEIDDEYDAQEVGELIRRQPDGSYRVLGRTEVHRLNETARLQLPLSDDYETVAGLVLDRLKRMPKVGEAVAVDGATITVVAATERSVDELLVRPARAARRPGGAAAPKGA